jgi:hypothetical protein
MANKVLLIGQILQKVSDPEVTKLLGELMSELSNEENNETAAVSGVAGAQNYVVCVEATLQDGSKVQHPVVGSGYGIPTSVDDYTMTVSTDLVELQQECAGMQRMIENALPVKVRYVPVSDEALETLKEKLKELINQVSNLLDEVAQKKAEAYGLMNVELSADDVSEDMLADVIRKTIYAGAALDKNGNVVDKPAEKYVEEEAIERQKAREGSNDDDNDSYGEDDDICERCPNDYNCKDCDYNESEDDYEDDDDEDDDEY